MPDELEARLQRTTGTTRVISPGLLPRGYVPLLPIPHVIVHGEAGRFGQFETRALLQEFAPSALVSAHSEQDLHTEHGDTMIFVYVIPRDAIPAAMADALRRQPIAGPIPDSVLDETTHHRSLKQLRDDFVVAVKGDFSKPEIVTFLEQLDVDTAAANLLLGRADDPKRDGPG